MLNKGRPRFVRPHTMVYCPPEGVACLNGNTALTRQGTAWLGAMVRSGTSVYIYWRGAQPGALRVLDLSGRPLPERLDRTGERVIQLSAGQTGVYLDDLHPGCLYCVELGRVKGGRFMPAFGTAPVQTPGLPGRAAPHFPAPYHRS